MPANVLNVGLIDSIGDHFNHNDVSSRNKGKQQVLEVIPVNYMT